MIKILKAGNVGLMLFFIGCFMLGRLIIMDGLDFINTFLVVDWDDIFVWMVILSKLDIALYTHHHPYKKSLQFPLMTIDPHSPHSTPQKQNPPTLPQPIINPSYLSIILYHSFPLNSPSVYLSNFLTYCFKSSYHKIVYLSML